MAGQDVDAEGNGPDQDVDDGHKGAAALFLLLADHDLDDGQEEGQPGGGGDDHGKDDADDEKGAELVGNARDQGREAPQPEHAPKDVHKGPRQPELEQGIEAIGAGQGQHIKDGAGRIEGRMLPRSEKGHAGK